MLEVIERNELDDIGSSVSSQRLRVESLIITIELVHHTEVSITHTHDDDREWVVGTTHNLVNRLAHVIDHTIGND